MKYIRNQDWEETNKYLILTLREPYWGAWSKYGWDRGVEGFSISPEAIKVAKEGKRN